MRLRMNQAIVERLTAVPGVESAGSSAFNDGLPLDGDGRSGPIFVEGRPADRVDWLRELQFVSPRFFETLRTPLIAGRTFEWEDVHQARPVAVVSESLARAEWGSASATVGRRISRLPSGP